MNFVEKNLFHISKKFINPINEIGIATENSNNKEIFNFKNKVGCFQSLNVSYNELSNMDNNNLQRGSLKNEYIYFVDNPVGCLKNINVDNLINYINEYNNLI